jgi:DNA-binding NarL/FixJ family response regulator
MSSLAPVLVPQPELRWRVAVGSPDGALAGRITAALAWDLFTVLASADAPELPDVVVHVGDRSASRRAAEVRALRSRLGGSRIVVVVPADAGRIRHTLEAGADGVVLEPELEDALAPTVAAVAAGQVVAPRRRRAEIERPALSHREKQALHLVAIGLTNSEIATRLYLTESTVKSHLTSVFSKLGVHSRAEAAALALDPDEARGLGLAAVLGFRRFEAMEEARS